MVFDDFQHYARMDGSGWAPAFKLFSVLPVLHGKKTYILCM